MGAGWIGRATLIWLGLLGGAGQADEPPRAHLVLQLSGVRQAQFAGYYVAQARHYYTALGLDVTIRPGPPDGDAAVPEPGADIWSAWLPQALAAREHGLKLVNFAQIFLHSGLELVCRKASAIHAPGDLKGKTIGVWPGDAQIPFLAWMRKIGLAVPGDVAIVPTPRAQGEAATAPLLNRDVACITALNYEQYWDVVATGLAPEDLQVFRYGDAGVAPLQDGLYATEAALADPARADALVRFLRASLRGWAYAVAHQPDAVQAVTNDETPDNAADLQRQTRMMSSVARLTEAGLQRPGYLEPAAFDRSVQLLLQAGPTSPITTLPSGAWTHDVWAKAVK